MTEGKECEGWYEDDDKEGKEDVARRPRLRDAT
jgi:hypothetical protein